MNRGKQRAFHCSSGRGFSFARPAIIGWLASFEFKKRRKRRYRRGTYIRAPRATANKALLFIAHRCRTQLREARPEACLFSHFPRVSSPRIGFPRRAAEAAAGLRLLREPKSPRRTGWDVVEYLPLTSIAMKWNKGTQAGADLCIG